MVKQRDQMARTRQKEAAQLTQSALNGAPLPRTTLLVIAGGLLSAIVFMLVYVIEGIVRPGYNSWQQPVSALSLGPGGWLQQTNFIVFGIIALFTVPAVHTLLRSGVSAVAYPIMKALSGISFIMLGIFSQDPTSGYPVGTVAPITPSLSGSIHIIFSFVSFIGLAVGSFVLARRLAREPRWRGWSTYSILNGLLAFVFIALYGTLAAQHSGIAGLFERLPGIVDTIFGLAFITRLYGIQRDAQTQV